MLSRLFIAVLWSPEGKGLTSWLLFVMFIVIVLLLHLVPSESCGTGLYRFLILAVFLTVLIMSAWVFKEGGFAYAIVPKSHMQRVLCKQPKSTDKSAF